MHHSSFVVRHARAIAGFVLAGLLILGFLPVQFQGVNAQHAAGIRPNIVVIPPGEAYRQTNFVSDVAGVGATQDPLLVNPWGIALPGSFWITSNGTSNATNYGGDVSGTRLVE